MAFCVGTVVCQCYCTKGTYVQHLQYTKRHLCSYMIDHYIRTYVRMYGQYGKTAVRVKSRVFAIYVHLRIYVCWWYHTQWSYEQLLETCSMYVVLMF